MDEFTYQLALNKWSEAKTKKAKEELVREWDGLFDRYQDNKLDNNCYALRLLYMTKPDPVWEKLPQFISNNLTYMTPRMIRSCVMRTKSLEEINLIFKDIEEVNLYNISTWGSILKFSKLVGTGELSFKYMTTLTSTITIAQITDTELHSSNTALETLITIEEMYKVLRVEPGTYTVLEQSRKQATENYGFILDSQATEVQSNVASILESLTRVTNSLIKE